MTEPRQTKDIDTRLRALLRSERRPVSGLAVTEADTLKLLKALARAIFEDIKAQPAAPLGGLQATARQQNDPLDRQGHAPPKTSCRQTLLANLPVSDSNGLHSDTLALPQTWQLSRKWRALLIITLVACFSVLFAIGVVGMFLSGKSIRNDRPTIQSNHQIESLVSSNLGAAPSHQSFLDLQLVKKAMTDCDLEAARTPDGLYLLVIPLMPTGGIASSWASHGEAYDSLILLWSESALEGLRMGALALSSPQYNFSVVDPSTEKTHTWKPATGLFKFVHPDAIAISQFKLGFDSTGLGGGRQWSAEFPRNKGLCYWVSVLFRG